MRTEEGKQISSRNATKHGCCSASTLIVKGETIEDYKALENVWFKAYRPKDDAEWQLVEDMVQADWFTKRAARNLAEMEERLGDLNPLDWTDEQAKRMALYQRYHTARTNTLTKARKAVEDYRKNRAAEIIKAERHEMFKRKHEDDNADVEEVLRQMEDAAAKKKMWDDALANGPKL